MSDQPSGAPPPHFIVIVPGYMGSRLRDRQTGEIVWLDIPSLLRDPFHITQALDNLFKRMHYPNDDLVPAGIVDQVVFVPPLFKQEHYGRLLEKLESMGYDTPGEPDFPERPPVYTFAYDWRQDNRISARQLGQAVQRWRDRHADAKAWLIGHSNGGIVSRWYIEKEGGADHVERLFLMGSPWDGAPKAMQVLIEGLDMFLLRFFNNFDVPRRTRELVLSFPSYYQLIPSHFPFLHDEYDQDIDPFADMSWLDNDRQRQMLLDGKRFNEELGTTLSVETLCFFGVKKPTTVGGLVHLGPGKRWQGVEWDRSEEGDGTVPKRSAVHPQAHEKLPYAVGHGDIYVNPAVLNKLEWELADKYRMGVMAMEITDRLRVQFEPLGDVFDPGQAIPVWASVAERESGAPIYGARITVHLEWSQGLPGINDNPPAELPAIQLIESLQEAGRYEGELRAPQALGYYRLVAEVAVAGEEPVPLEELILVEGEIDPASLGEPIRLTGARTEGGYPPLEGEVRRTWDREDEAPPPSPAPEDAPGPETEGPDGTGSRFLGPEITEHDVGQPLPLEEEFTLAFLVDVKAFRGARLFEDERLFQPGEQVARLNVKVTSQDFIVHTRQPQELRVPRQGRSRNKARFDLEPRRSGEGLVNALFYRENNFIQGMTVRLNVESGEGAIAGTESLGRATDSALAVQPRDVLLFIKNMGERFDLTMVGAVAAEASLSITAQELNYRTFQARAALQEVVYLAQGPSAIFVHPRDRRPAENVNLAFQTGIDIPDEMSAEALRRLGEAGWLLYNDLFYGPNAGPDANLLGDRLRELAEMGTLKLQIVSQQFCLPWGLLYLAEEFDPDDIQPERFLGLKHIIEHIPLQRNMPVLENEIPSQPQLAVSLNLDSSIDAQMGLGVVQEQLDYWQAIEEEGQAQVSRRYSDQEFIDALKDPQSPDQILYFYGHAVSQGLDDPAGPDACALTLTGGKSITLRDLKLRASPRQALSGAPLVFVNACESAELSPLFYDGFMPFFTHKGARGMIGTECEVPARFAAEWARRFFDYFLYQGEPLGEVILGLRREFFYQHHNPLGLLYALYCDGDTRVSPILG